MYLTAREEEGGVSRETDGDKEAALRRHHALNSRPDAVRDEAFRSGRGVGWHEHSPCLFRGIERFFRTGYAVHLVQE